MRVVALGGAGRYFQPALEALAASDLVSEIVIAGRRLASAEAAAARAGPKGRAVEVDALDEPALTALAAPADLLINVTGPYFKTLLPALRAAIAAGTHYLDYSEDGATVEAALALDEAAKGRGADLRMDRGRRDHLRRGRRKPGGDRGERARQRCPTGRASLLQRPDQDLPRRHLGKGRGLPR
jgi:hypothetical protein